jgi:hypothetical protein
MLGERKRTWGIPTSSSNLLKNRVQWSVPRGAARAESTLETSNGIVIATRNFPLLMHGNFYRFDGI